ncbi:hypothetical protein BDV12DRAFT_164279, partial [Aspergillus spectabilis]
MHRPRVPDSQAPWVRADFYKFAASCFEPVKLAGVGGGFWGWWVLVKNGVKSAELQKGAEGGDYASFPFL